MKAGDLVKVIVATGNPIGIILDVRDRTCGYKIKQYLVQLLGSSHDRKAHAYLTHHLEIVR